MSLSHPIVHVVDALSALGNLEEATVRVLTLGLDKIKGYAMGAGGGGQGGEQGTKGNGKNDASISPFLQPQLRA